MSGPAFVKPDLDPIAIDGVQWLVVRRQRSGLWPPSLRVQVEKLSDETFDFKVQAIAADQRAFTSKPEHFAVAACAELVADGYLAPSGTRRNECLRALTEAVAFVQTQRERPTPLASDPPPPSSGPPPPSSSAPPLSSRA